MRTPVRVPESAKVIRGLPRNLGGLGIKRLKDILPWSYCASFLVANQHIRPAITNLFTRWNGLPDHFDTLLKRTVPSFKCLSVNGKVEFWNTSEEIRANASEEMLAILNDASDQIHQEPHGLPEHRRASVDLSKVLSQKSISYLFSRAAFTRLMQQLSDRDPSLRLQPHRTSRRLG